MTPIGGSIIALGVAIWICTITAVYLVLNKGVPEGFDVPKQIPQKTGDVELI